MMKNILSIQSAVTLGAVGNTMAQMVATAMGHHINRIDTIMLAAHPGALAGRMPSGGIKAGDSLSDQAFQDIIDALLALNIGDRIDAIMTGYMAKASQARTAAQLIKAITDDPEKTRPVLIDPAIGDHGRLYVEEEVAQAITAHLFDYAHIITPNHFELSYLSGVEIDSRHAAEDAARIMLARHPNLEGVAITGLNLVFETRNIFDGWITREDAFFIRHERLIHHPKKNSGGLPGGGDLFAAIAMSFRLGGFRPGGSRMGGSRMAGLDWHGAIARASHAARQIIKDSDRPQTDRGEADILPSAIFKHLKAD